MRDAASLLLEERCARRQPCRLRPKAKSRHSRLPSFNCQTATCGRSRRARAISRLTCPRDAVVARPRDTRGAGRAGPRLRPVARLQQKMQAAGTTGPAGRSGPPCAIVLRCPSCSPWGPGFLAPITRADACASAAGLTSASGGRDHTTSPSAMPTLVWRGIHVYRSPPPRFVTTRTPSA